MADIITRSIPAIPYQGGTPRTAQPYSAAVQLTPTRMVWTYCQTNPNWRFFVIVDTPEGWANGGTPTVTVSRMQDQKAYRGINLQMARLNDNAFVVMDMQDNSGYFASTATTWSYEVFEIDSNNVFTRTTSNLNAYDTLVGASGASANFSNTTGFMLSTQITNGKYSNPIALIPGATDNNLIWAGFFDTSRVSVTTMNYNPTSKALTVGSTSVLQAGWSITSATSMEVYWRPIPGSTKKAITFRQVGAINSWTNAAIQNSTVIVNADGTFVANYPPSSNTLGTTTTTSVAQDMAMLSETRAARANWTWAYYYGLTSGSTGSQPGTLVNDGYGSYTTTSSTAPMMIFPMDANYMMLMDRTHFVSNTSGNIKVKIIRRDDANFVSQSTGSAVAATGFDVTAPWIEVWRHDARPRTLANGDLFWWGLDASGALAWNILKNAA